MTAEVAVMNRIGVALAADSAVTIGHDAHKIYTSAEKLFQLSSDAPIGIMVYGNANFVGLPWETIIKQYRTTHVHRKFDTIAEQAESFWAHLTNNEAMFPKDRELGEVKQILAEVLVTTRNFVHDQISRQVKEAGELTDEQVASTIDSAIRTVLKVMSDAPRNDRFSGDQIQKIRSEYAPLAESLYPEVFGGLPIAAETKRDLLDSAVGVLCKVWCGESKAGVVFAGFGEGEYFPSFLSFEAEGTVCGIPRVSLHKQHVISGDSDACIQPFAQTDPVDHFLQGIHPQMEDELKDAVRHVLNEFVQIVTGHFSSIDSAAAADVKAVAEAESEAIVGGLFAKFAEKKATQWIPILSTVAALPKDELAAMAESLVNLTKFRRKVTPEKETVGGPIDVAVITKGDGFVWIKRKHYFSPELNPRIMARYRERS